MVMTEDNKHIFHKNVLIEQFLFFHFFNFCVYALQRRKENFFIFGLSLSPNHEQILMRNAACPCILCQKQIAQKNEIALDAFGLLFLFLDGRFCQNGR